MLLDMFIRAIVQTLRWCKRKIKGFFSMNSRPSWTASMILSVLLFVIAISAYQYTAYQRHRENPDDKVVPTIGKLVDKFGEVAFEKDRKEQYTLWVDMKASAFRFFSSLALLSLAVVLGITMGTLPYFEQLCLKFVIFFDKVPAGCLLPILFIYLGLEETSKIVLIFIGVFPTIALDTYYHTKAIPQEQLIKGFTLGATDSEVAYTIVFPQIWPKVLNTIRLNFKAMLFFQILGESLAATEGMCYRIFVVRRYLAMDTILVYVMIISCFAFSMDFIVNYWIKKRYSRMIAK